MNQHYKEAERLSAESSLIHEWPTAERAAQAGRGQIEATLALAYEQRTANLIALMNLKGEWVLSSDKTLPQIIERLGL